MNEKYDASMEKVKKYGQEHLLKFYDKLSKDEKEKLLDDILTIDLQQINKLYEQTKVEKNFTSSKIEPIPYIDKTKMSKEELEKYEKIGEHEIRKGKYAVVTMAGGQGTRLGHNGPKGTFDIGLDSHKSIFEILCDNLKMAKEKYNVTIPWYIMTSDENNKETEEFFKKNRYFNYPKEAVTFFKQGQLPMVDEQGKILLNEHGQIKQAADGHGGIFVSMRKNGIIYDMQTRGIEWVFIGGVDNVLAKMADPIFIGVAIDEKVQAVGKSIVKVSPKEKVGVFCKRNGKPSVIEYTEITDEMAEARDRNGELLYGESHALCNLFNIKAIDMFSKDFLPYHSAHKKASYINEDGNIVKPEKPNAYKFEAFLFDAFESLDNMAILRVKREEEFAPVKNSEGADSPETARELYNNYWKNK